MKASFRIATRGSPLALVQANEVRDRLAAAHPELAAPGASDVPTGTLPEHCLQWIPVDLQWISSGFTIDLN